jgi:hypothetical protein
MPKTRKNKYKGGGLFDGWFGTTSTLPSTTSDAGILTNISSWFTTSTEKAKQVGTNLLNKADEKITNAQQQLTNLGDNISSKLGLKDTTPVSYYETVQPQAQPQIIEPVNITPTTTDTTITPTYVSGGRRKRKTNRKYKYKGGKGISSLGLAYYATPIEPYAVKIAQPTYWMEYKGGKKKRKTQRKHKSKKRHTKH